MGTTTKWVLVLGPRDTGGHAFWRAEGGLDDGTIAVTDGSIRRHGDPASTDDGLVLVDRAEVRARGITLESTAARPTASIPCLNPSNGRCSIVAGTREAVALAQYMDVPLRLVADGVAFVPEGGPAKAPYRVKWPKEVDPDVVVNPCRRCGEETGDGDQMLCEICRGHKGEPYPEPDDLGGVL
jgi:hypothetical protein